MGHEINIVNHGPAHHAVMCHSLFHMIKNQKYVIRIPTKSELSLLSNIESKADELLPPGTFPEEMVDCSIGELSESLSGGYLYVAEVDNRLVGFCMSRILGGYLHLQQLSVLPDYGRRGIGTGLLKTAITLTKSRGFPGVTLTAFRNIRWNAPFYSAQGFTVISEFNHFAELESVLKYETSVGLTDRVAMLYKTSYKY